MYILHYTLYTQTHKNKTTCQILLEKGGGGRVNWDIMEAVNLFKVHCIHTWNYHNEAPSNY
jgi:hypothetical protein